MKNFKKIVFIFLAIIFFVVASKTQAQIGMMGSGWNMMDGNYYQNNTTVTQPESKDLKDALQSIYKTQNIDTQAKVDCSKVTDDQFNKLGDAYMGIMISNEGQHEAMDNMMGGEGSESLTQAHINMGRSYLGCWSNYNSGPVYMPMMGTIGGVSSSSNNYQPNNLNSMMGNYYSGSTMGYGGFGFIFMIFWWVLIIAGIVLLVRYLVKQSQNKNEKNMGALNILEERYAKGEIEKKEFEEKKKDLKN